MKYFLVGIKGTGMSALAKVLFNLEIPKYYFEVISKKNDSKKL